MTDPRENERDAIALDAAADLVEAQIALAQDARERIALARAYARLQRMRVDLLRGAALLRKGTPG